MSTSRLLKIQSKTFSASALNRYLNEERGTNYKNLPEAIGGIGVAVAGLVLVAPLATAVAGEAIGSLGVGMAIAAVINIIKAGMESEEIADVLDEIDADSTKRLKVKTKFYEWTSGSGNSTSYYTVVSFMAV